MSFGTATFEGQRADVHYIVADTDAHTAQDATALVDEGAGAVVLFVVRHVVEHVADLAFVARALIPAHPIKPAVRHVDLVRKVAYHRRFRATGQQQFDQDTPDFQDAFGMGLNLHAVGNRQTA